MTALSKLRAFAARQHASVGQVYEEGVAYWVHLLIAEMVARMFFPGDSRLLEGVWGHDLIEDTGTTAADLRREGFCEPAVGDIEAVTDQPGENRAERKAKTLPVIKARGAGAIKLKLCDRIANVLWGNYTHNHNKLAMYRKEQVQLEAVLFDPSDSELLPAWNCLRSLLDLEPYSHSQPV